MISFGLLDVRRIDLSFFFCLTTIFPLTMATSTMATTCLPPETAHRRILIFLDIDGVLLPFPDATPSTCGAIFPDDAMANLSRVLAAFPTSELILSSTWRAQDKLIAEILQSFELYGQAFGGPLKDLQTFADVTDRNFHSERQFELYKYLFSFGSSDSSSGKSRADGNAVAWVALDDEELLEGETNAAYRSKFEGRAVKVDSRIGLTERDASMAIDLLQKQLGWQ